MAKYFVLNTKKNGITVIIFERPALNNYAIRCQTVTRNGETVTSVNVPPVTWRHKDKQTALDYVDGLQKAANYIQQIRGGRSAAFKSFGGEPVFNDGEITARVWQKFEDPIVKVVNDNGFYRWHISSWASGDNDSAGLAKIGGTVMNVIKMVEEKLK